MWTALFAQLLPIFYMFVSPVLTEMVKDVAKKVKATVPPNVVPVIGAVIGTIAGTLSESLDASTTLNPETGLLAGLAGTGLHQALFAKKYTHVATK